MMNTHRDPRDRRAHRLAAVAGGLPPALAAAEADPAELPEDVAQALAAHAAEAFTPGWEDRARSSLDSAVHALPEDLTEARAAGNLLDGAVRLELGIDAWRAEARTVDPEPAEDLGPGYPPDYPDLPAVPEHLAHSYAADISSGRGVESAHAANLPAAGTSSGPPAGELTANLPVCSCGPHLCLDEDCPACAGLDPELPCPIADGDGDQGQDGEAAGAVVPEPGPAPAALQPHESTPEEVRQGTAQLPAHRGRVLAWASRHDPQSLQYLVRDRLAHRVPVQDRAWEHGPILDQGTVPPLSLHDGSSCTGNMAVNLRNILEAAAVPASTRAEDIDWLGEDDARTLYEHAQELDEWPGHAYPGTSVLAAMKAGQAAGWWDSYLWCQSTRDIAQAVLQVGPVGIGVPLTQGMAAPDRDGVITAAGDQLGGHAMAVFALRRTVAGRPGPWFGLLQSYGPKVGDGGQLWIHHTDLARLLPGTGEAAVPIVAGMLT